MKKNLRLLCLVFLATFLVALALANYYRYDSPIIKAAIVAFFGTTYFGAGFNFAQPTEKKKKKGAKARTTKK